MTTTRIRFKALGSHGQIDNRSFRSKDIGVSVFPLVEETLISRPALIFGGNESGPRLESVSRLWEAMVKFYFFRIFKFF